MFTRKSRLDNAMGEVNLVPFIDLLSVCICFMLLTAVWIQAGAISTKQGLGTETEAKLENKKSLWVELDAQNAVIVSTYGLPKNTSRKKISSQELTRFVMNLKMKNPELRTALVLPNSAAKYEELIHAMDSLKKADIADVGIAPL